MRGFEDGPSTGQVLCCRFSRPVAHYLGAGRVHVSDMVMWLDALTSGPLVANLSRYKLEYSKRPVHITPTRGWNLRLVSSSISPINIMILRVLPCRCFKPTMCCLRLQTSGTPAPCLLVNLHRHLRLLMYSSLMKSFFLGFSACKHGHFPMAPWSISCVARYKAYCDSLQKLVLSSWHVWSHQERSSRHGRRSQEEVRRGYPATGGYGWILP